MKNDVVDTDAGICVSVWVQGCPFHCAGCHNPETWDFNGGDEIDEESLLRTIIEAIPAYGIMRNLSILGGEPLCADNLNFTLRLIQTVKQIYPTIKIFIWSGYEFNQIAKNSNQSAIFEYVDTLVTGPFILAQRDITLPLRGSANQQIWRKNNEGILTLQKK